jgi:hypothetical protein
MTDKLTTDPTPLTRMSSTSSTGGDNPVENSDPVDNLDELLDLVAERIGYELDNAELVVEWLARRGVRLNLAQLRNIGAS